MEVIEGEGRFTGPSEIVVDGRRLPFAAAIIATGSAPAVPPVPGLGGERILTTETLWSLRELPDRLAILGGGPIGCELGQAFARLGSQVTIVEAADRLLVKEEHAAAALVRDRLVADGVEVRLDSTAVDVLDRALVVDGPGGCSDRAVRPRGGGRRPAARGPRSSASRRPAWRSGRRGRSWSTIGCAPPPGACTRRATSPQGCRSPTSPRTMPAWRPSTRSSGGGRTVDETIPWVTFTDPEVARVGLTETQARERWGDDVRVARTDYAHLDRAITEGVPYGFALLVADPRGRLVGATVAAPGGGEAIAELTTRVKAGARLDDVSRTVHAYPTLAEGPARAADEHLRRRYAAPRYRALAAPVLAVRRAMAGAR